MTTPTLYRYHPAYQEGRSAYAEGTRRSHNPYAATGNDQSASLAWWYGYDDEAEINPPYEIGEGVGHLPTNRYGLVIDVLTEAVNVIVLESTDPLSLLLPTGRPETWKFREIYRSHRNPNTLTKFAVEVAKRRNDEH